MIFFTHIPAPPAPISRIMFLHKVKAWDRQNTPPIPLHIGADGVWHRRPIRITVEDNPPFTVEDIQRVFTLTFKTN